MANLTKAELEQEVRRLQARVEELETAGATGTGTGTGTADAGTGTIDATLVDSVVAAAVDFVQKRQVASQLAAYHNTGPGAVAEAMKEVGKADRALTAAVLQLVEAEVEAVEAETGAETEAGAE